MYLGKIVELAPADELYRRPIHPYTEALLSAVPMPDRRSGGRSASASCCSGDVPSPIYPPAGCRFNPRCRCATDICSSQEPPLVVHAPGHLAACHHPLNTGGGPSRVTGRLCGRRRRPLDAGTGDGMAPHGAPLRHAMPPSPQPLSGS